jgi:alkylation response protein AidB-like acyl-CoA dehydrogenase
MFWIDMHAPGIKVKPVKQISGRSNFNEVWFDDLRISDTQRIGEVNDGWRMSLITLMNERLAIGGIYDVNFAGLFALARQTTGDNGTPILQDSAFREALADWYVASEGVRLTGLRTLTALSRGQTPGAEASISKIVGASLSQEVAHTALGLQGTGGLVSEPAAAILNGVFQQAFLASPGGRLAGGTDEILKNVVAERVLGLPGDIRVDKDIAFKDIPTG